LAHDPSALARGGILARASRRRFLGRCGWFVAGAEIFIVLVGVLVLVCAHPYLPLRRLLSGLPDVLLLSAPVVLPAAVLAGYAGVLADLHRYQALLAMRLAGRSPVAGLVTLMLPAVAVALLLLLLHSSVLPQASFRLRTELPAFGSTDQSLLLRLARRPNVLSGALASASISPTGTANELIFSASGDDWASVVVADAAVLHRPVPEAVCLTLRGGRLLRVDTGFTVTANVAFTELDVYLDEREVAGSSKQGIMALSHYTDAELRQLDAQLAYLQAAGQEVDTERRRRVAAASLFAAVRRQTAVLPLLFAALFACCLLSRPATASAEAAVRRRFIAACCMLLFAQTVVELLVGKRGAWLPAWVAWTPTLVVVVHTLVRVRREVACSR
jgi:hypothetical protein